jgi:hypothetical protein
MFSPLQKLKIAARPTFFIYIQNHLSLCKRQAVPACIRKKKCLQSLPPTNPTILTMNDEIWSLALFSLLSFCHLHLCSKGNFFHRVRFFSFLSCYFQKHPLRAGGRAQVVEHLANSKPWVQTQVPKTKVKITCYLSFWIHSGCYCAFTCKP